MNTIKAWFYNHKCLVFYVTGIVLGGYLCTKINDFRIANGWRIWHENGLVRFFNPEGIEVTAEEFAKIVK